MNINTFRNLLRAKLKEQKLSLSTLASLSDLSEDTLRSIIYGKSQDIKLSTLIKIADVLNCSIDELVNRSTYSHDEQILFNKIHNLPQCSRKSIQIVATLEEKCLLEKSRNGKDLIPLFIPKGNMKDGVYYDGSIYGKIDITKYPLTIKKECSFGIKVVTENYEPIYHINDILLISAKSHPRQSDIVLYIDNNGKLYLRKYTQLGLEPLGPFLELIPMRELSNFTPLGVVLKTINEFDIEQYR
ncbi:MAG: helix-turn-helix domain-containing protein [Lachnospiraceae bacterium]|nr:helix-turn-helix domain-containing protein [Lachnospiraceae bacterium]